MTSIKFAGKGCLAAGSPCTSLVADKKEIIGRIVQTGFEMVDDAAAGFQGLGFGYPRRFPYPGTAR